MSLTSAWNISRVYALRKSAMKENRMLSQFTDRQLHAELRRRQLALETASSEIRTTQNVLIVTAVMQRPSKTALDVIRNYVSAKSKRRVVDVIYDAQHKCVRVVTTNTSKGQNFRDDHDWLVGKCTTDSLRMYWTDRDGNTRVRGLLHKAGITFKTVVKG